MFSISLCINRAELAQNFLAVVSWLRQSVLTDDSPSPQTYAHQIYCFFHPKSFCHRGVLGSRSLCRREVSGSNLAGWNQLCSFSFVFMWLSHSRNTQPIIYLYPGGADFRNSCYFQIYTKL